MKFPPTKNWRAMTANLDDELNGYGVWDNEDEQEVVKMRASCSERPRETTDW